MLLFLKWWAISMEMKVDVWLVVGSLLMGKRNAKREMLLTVMTPWRVDNKSAVVTGSTELLIIRPAATRWKWAVVNRSRTKENKRGVRPAWYYRTAAHACGLNISALNCLMPFVSVAVRQSFFRSRGLIRRSVYNYPRNRGRQSYLYMTSSWS